MVRLGELSHSVFWLSNLKVSTVQLTDTAPGGRVETARRWPLYRGPWNAWRLAVREIPPGERSSNNEVLECWRLAVVTEPPSGGDCDYVFLGAWRLAIRDTRQAVWELAAPGGTCPPLGDLCCCSLEF